MNNDQNTQQASLELDQFFPYQLTELQNAISHNISEVYKEYNLSRQQWRIVAVLGDENKSTAAQMLSAKQLGELTNLDKMQTSRAIAKLEESEMVVRTQDENDKRSILLKLTEKGHTLYRTLIPLVIEREQKLLSALTEKQQQQFVYMMNKLLKQAQRI